MSHAIPIQLMGDAHQTAVNQPAQNVAITQPVTLAPKAAPPITTLPQALAVVARPTYANHSGEEWSTRELQLVENAFRTGGYEAAYKIVPHRSKPAVRGRLQRAGLIVPRNAQRVAIP